MNLTNVESRYFINYFLHCFSCDYNHHQQQHHHHQHHHSYPNPGEKLPKNCSFDYRTAIDSCTGGCMTTGRNKQKSNRDWATSSTGSLPSTFRSKNHERDHRYASDECFTRRYFDHSNCDIYCSSCMNQSFQPVPYRREYYNTSNNYYDFRNYLRSPDDQRYNQMHQPESIYRAPSRSAYKQYQPPQYNRHKQYNHLHPSTTSCSNYVN